MFSSRFDLVSKMAVALRDASPSRDSGHLLHRRDDNDLERLRKRLATEVQQRETCQATLQRLIRASEFCRERLAPLPGSSGLQSTSSNSREALVRRVFDALQPLESELADVARCCQSCSSTAVLGVTPAGSYDVLRQSLEVTQRRCEELSGSMLRQTEANGELEQTLATAKAANRRLLEQLRAQSDELDHLRSQQATDTQRFEELQRQAREEAEAAAREFRRREEEAVAQNAEREALTTSLLAERLRKVLRGLGRAKEAVLALRQGVGSDSIAAAHKEMEAQLQSVEQRLNSKVEAFLRFQSSRQSAAKLAVRELGGQVEHENEKRQQESLRTAQQHAVLAAECDNLQARSSREVEVLSAQLQANRRVIATERSLSFQENAKREREVEVVEAERSNLEVSLEKMRQEIKRLETLAAAAKSDCDAQAKSLFALRKQARETSDAMTTAIGGNEHLKAQLAEQQRHAQKVLEAELASRRLEQEQQLVTARSCSEANLASIHQRIAEVETELGLRSAEVATAKERIVSSHALQHLREEIAGLRESCAEAGKKRGTLEESAEKERWKYDEEKFKLKSLLEKLATETSTAEAQLHLAISQAAAGQRKASTVCTEQEGHIQVLEEKLRTSKAQLTDAKRKLAAENDALERVSYELEQQNSRATLVQGDVEAELCRRRKELDQELQALQGQVAAERREADACQEQADYLRASALPEVDIGIPHANDRQQAEKRAELARLQREAERQGERHTSLRQDLGRVRRLLDEGRVNLDWVRREISREECSVTQQPDQPGRAALELNAADSLRSSREAEAMERLMKKAMIEHDAKLKSAEEEHKASLARQHARLDVVVAENERLKLIAPGMQGESDVLAVSRGASRSPVRPAPRSSFLSPSRATAPFPFTSPLRSFSGRLHDNLSPSPLRLAQEPQTSAAMAA
eukprot:TRINITY_DN33443_c0_g1_i1.p1 TRINITY_DN33443_c0_g1~~TRINITY_DN33443_c0_g1_i1.p1  ORF type:complete len:928 (-),score=225.11 TRINITY_DN33443_c0_g1_i1:223-3006(-)